MIKKVKYIWLFFFLVFASGFAQEDQIPKFFFSQVGEASFYGNEFHNRKTSSGEIYDRNAFTAAHPFLAFGTSLKVTNLQNNKTIIVRINDRGPHIKGRIIDLSYASAEKLDMIKGGTAKVKIETLAEPEENKLDEIVIYNDLVYKGEEYQIQLKDSQDSSKISKIISNNGKLKISLLKFKNTPPAIPEAINADNKDPIPVSIKSTETDRYFSIQVGAFLNYENADELQRLLTEKKYRNIELNSFEENGSRLYKVTVGNLRTREEATILKNKLLKDNFIGFIISKGK